MEFSRRELAIPAELSRLPDVRAFVDAAALEFGFGSDECFLLKSAVNEAVANAIEHGSATADDQVTIEVAAEGGALVFYVRDTGVFKPRVWRGGDIAERGRGLEFITRMMDEVDVRPGGTGTEVRMAKRP